MRIDKFWADPPSRTTMCVRGRGQTVGGIRDNCKQTKVCEASVASFIDQYVGLDE